MPEVTITKMNACALALAESFPNTPERAELLTYDSRYKQQHMSGKFRILDHLWLSSHATSTKS